MAIPNFQAIMLPFLKRIGDAKDHKIGQITDQLADYFELTPAERNELLPSQTQTRFRNRVHWVKAHFKMAGLLVSAGRGVCKISARGSDVLKSNPPKIDLHFLAQFPEYAVNRKGTESGSSANKEDEVVAVVSPEEAIEDSIQSLRKQLAGDLLDQIHKNTPAFFERLVVEVLVKMGYGGSIQDAGEAIGKSGDEGIDGIIKEDKLGLDAIYIQAKRWKDVVGRPQIQNFVGALHGKSNKGVFITTSSFTQEAINYSKALGNTKVILINGDSLAD